MDEDTYETLMFLGTIATVYAAAMFAISVPVRLIWNLFPFGKIGWGRSWFFTTVVITTELWHEVQERNTGGR